MTKPPSSEDEKTFDIERPKEENPVNTPTDDAVDAEALEAEALARQEAMRVAQEEEAARQQAIIDENNELHLRAVTALEEGDPLQDG